MTNKNVSKKSQISKPRNRLFLVVADDSKELHQLFIMLQEELRQLEERLHYFDASNLLKDSFGEELLKLWKQKLN